MTAVGLTLLLAGLVAQAEDIPKTPAKITVVAVQALNEGHDRKQIDPRLKGVKKAIERLDYDSFHQIKSVTKDMPYRTETKIEINDRYSLHLTPISKGPRGRVRVEAKILMAPRRKGGKPVEALSKTVLLMAPGKHINLGGLRLDQGELIIVLQVRG